MAPTGPARCPLLFPAWLSELRVHVDTPHSGKVASSRFQRELTQQQFNTWIRPLRLELAGEGLRLIAPNRFVLQWVKERFAGRIEELAAVAVGRPLRLAFVVADAADRPAPAAAAARRSAPNRSPWRPVAANRRVSIPDSRSRPSYPARPINSPARAGFRWPSIRLRTTLSSSTAASVSEDPPDPGHRQPYPGKQSERAHPLHPCRDLRVRRRSAPHQHKAFDDFKRYYRSLDLLLIDDIQFFSNKSRTQEEFFYLFNTLIEAHKQVVITCDTYPKEIAGIEERLISRFGWGLTVALEPPELEMRVAILQSRLHRQE